MNRFGIALLLVALTASPAHALESGRTWITLTDGSISMVPTGQDTSTAKVMLDGAPTLLAYTYASMTGLTSYPVGSIAWCSDCVASNPCFPSGTGAFARKEGTSNTAWNCARGNEIDQKLYCATDGGGVCSGGGTWSKPAIQFAAKTVTIRCMGGGGGGGGGGLAPASAQGGAGGGGGAGGSFCEATYAWDTIPSSLTVTVGAPTTTGGNGNTGTSAVPGSPGAQGNPSFVQSDGIEYCRARGGNQGNGGAGSSFGTGGVADSLPRPWGNYAGGQGKQASSPATSPACASAGPYSVPCGSVASSSDIVAPFGVATFAGGSGGGGGAAGNSAPTAGGDGGRSLSAGTAAGGAAGSGAAGTAGASFTPGLGSTAGKAGGGGGGGGGRSTAGVAGAGGAGGYPGGGGGGGGGHLSVTGNTSGAGGKGAGGYCEIITQG